MATEHLLSSLKSLLSTATSIAQTRLELLSSDVSVARAQFIKLLVLILFCLFCLFFGLVMLALWIVVYSSETNRMAALAILTGGFLLAGLVFGLMIMRAIKTMPGLFAASITELEKDRSALNHH
ncbi:phage holin family protein [Polynucleobacter paludilacus]|uniref:phage holin family protein n=1 Tax=Polynucleobacter paludilacus TaxID=1855895 RepID=UPI001BFE6BE9|nr:phage holin family protein [Polynucleobacter paludilacus]QWD45065.1 phage holin family protein [Polynucleobacter paneuropaeus]QWD86313.1 phage holin family protein [Polynucleobacter paludilacus]